MSCAVERCRAGAKDAAGTVVTTGAGAGSRTAAARTGRCSTSGGAQLLRGEPDEVRDTPQEVVEPVRLATARYRRARTRLETRGTQGSRRS